MESEKLFDMKELEKVVDDFEIFVDYVNGNDVILIKKEIKEDEYDQGYKVKFVFEFISVFVM